MNPEIETLKHENLLLRDLARTHEVDRDTKDHYERILTDIGKSIGCGHIDERLPSCVTKISEERDDAVTMLRQIVARNGVTPQGVKQIEDWLKEIGESSRR
jgi:hypothetical protein